VRCKGCRGGGARGKDRKSKMKRNPYERVSSKREVEKKRATDVFDPR